MNIYVDFYAEAREFIGSNSIELTIKDRDACDFQVFFGSLIEELGAKIGGNIIVNVNDLWTLRKGYTLMINNEILQDWAVNKEQGIQDGDKVGLLPPFSGG